MRLSDIIRKKDTRSDPSRREKIPEISKPINLKELVPQTENQPSATFRKFNQQSRPHPTLPPAQNSAMVGSHPALAPKELYGNLIQETCWLLSGFSKISVQLPDLDQLCEVIERTIETLASQPYKLLEMTDRSTPDDYLPGHLANVAVLSIALSQQLNWTAETQRAVGIGALLHDVGMVFHRPDYARSVPMISEERQALRKLSQEGWERLKTFLGSLAPEYKKTIEEIILQSQERISGQGYPHGLRDNQISQEAQVVGLCDTYEAITHPRPYRHRKLPHDALRTLIEHSGETFDGHLIKSLWETLSLFPPGSYIKLNTGEIARVTGLNKKLPTRPVVQVILSPSAEKVRIEKNIDLSQTPGVVVERAVDECALDLQDRRLLLEFQARKWWVK